MTTYRTSRVKIIVALVGLLSLSSLCAGAPLPGQIVSDPTNPSWLKYSGAGSHFLAGPGDPEDFLYRGTLNGDGTRSGDQLDLINKLKASGANAIYLQAIRSHGGDGDPTHNPFIDHDPSKGLNLSVLDQWETWFTEMDNNGIVIYFFFYDDSASVWNSGDQVTTEEENFVQTIVDRFEHHKHLIWVVAEEYGEAFTPTRVSNIAEVIRTADDHDHVIGVHKLSGVSFSEFSDDPNIDQFTMQLAGSSLPTLHQEVVTAWNNASSGYNINMSEAPDWGTGASARKKAWAVALAGAYVMVLGMDIAATPVSDMEDLGRLASFMESTNFHEMAPHDELAYSATEYVLANPGDSYIAYSAEASSLQIGLRQLTAGVYDFRWFDPVTGTTVVQNNVDIGAGDQEWAKPQTIGDEVALHIQKVSTPSPSHFPKAAWDWKTPAEVGLDGGKLDQFAHNVGGDGCIVRNGYLVKCWGDPSTNADWASAAKPLLSTLLFFAASEAKISSVDEKIIDWGWTLDTKDEEMTFRHLANMTSGYARGEAPGESWAYNDYAIQLYAKTLERVFQQSLNEAAVQRMSALSFEDGSIFGSRGGYGVNASVRDFARIGWFWLNKGNWDGAQILPSDFFDNYMKANVPGDKPITASSGSDYLGVGTYGGETHQTPYGPGIYGFNWWFNSTVGTSTTINWPDAPADTFQANGHWGSEVVTVIPSLNLVVAARGDWGDFNPGSSDSQMNQNLKLLSDSVIADTTPPSPPSGLSVY